jgi:putative FmdB family regulatory protein
MPIYEYQCKKCKAHIEVFQKTTDKPPAKCRKCGGRLEKQISASSIQFKGSGFYVNDYAQNGKKGKKDAEKSESAESTPSSDKSDAKETSPTKKTSDSASSTKVPND